MKTAYYMTIVLILVLGGLSAEANGLPLKKVKTVKTEWVPVSSQVDDSVEVIEAVEIKEDSNGAMVVFEGDEVPQDDDNYEYIEVVPQDVADERSTLSQEELDDENFLVAEDKDQYSYAEMARPKGSQEPVEPEAKVEDNKRPVIQVIYQQPEQEPKPKKKWVRRRRVIKQAPSKVYQPVVVEQPKVVEYPQVVSRPEVTPQPEQREGSKGDVYHFYFNSRR